MSKEKLREDKTCLNCGHNVGHRYCSFCGQENTETVKTFYQLLQQFFEDFTHYDGTFWKTIFCLFFKPAALTKAYLSGKRKTYLPPIRLYIFISFLTFFCISLLPKQTTLSTTTGQEAANKELAIPSIDSLHIEKKSMDGLTKVGILSQQDNDTLVKIINQIKRKDTIGLVDFGYESTSELDSIQKFGREEEKVGSSKYWILKKWLTVKEENTSEEIMEKFMYSFINNLPKVLFLYMPIFAFILWLFHNKKKWFYFDHSIFTLHYFSFLLLLSLFLICLNRLLPLLGKPPYTDWINFVLQSAGIFWMIYYYFPAHRRLYGLTVIKSFAKSGVVIFINLILITFLTILFGLYTYITIH